MQNMCTRSELSFLKCLQGKSRASGGSPRIFSCQSSHRPVPATCSRGHSWDWAGKAQKP